jgi:hypothetical protein
MDASISCWLHASWLVRLLHRVHMHVCVLSLSLARAYKEVQVKLASANANETNKEESTPLQSARARVLTRALYGREPNHSDALN